MLLHYVAIALLALAGLLVLRWVLHRSDALGRRRPFPALSLILCLGLAAGAAYPVLVHARTEQRLAEAGSRLAGVRMEVHCQTFGEASVDTGPELGLVRFSAAGVPERRATLKWEQCRLLRAWIGARGRDATLDQVVAVHVLTHEAVHVSGLTDEAVTECRALQRDAWTARLLGADPATARELARRYWREVYPRMPAGYVSAQCRPGGALDETTDDAPWHADPAG